MEDITDSPRLISISEWTNVSSNSIKQALGFFIPDVSGNSIKQASGLQGSCVGECTKGNL